MFAPEQQQIEICLLKSNLEKIDNQLQAQRSSLPELDAENEQKYRETMSTLKVVRSLNVEMEKLKLENVELTAKRIQLKQQCDEINKTLEIVLQNREKLTESLKQEEQEIDVHICKYEDYLQEKAEKFRNTRKYYNEEEVNTEIDNVNSLIAELKNGISKKQSGVDELTAQLDAIHPVVPYNILELIGSSELKETLKSLTKQYEELVEKRKALTE